MGPPCSHLFASLCSRTGCLLPWELRLLASLEPRSQQRGPRRFGSAPPGCVLSSCRPSAGVGVCLPAGVLQGLTPSSRRSRGNSTRMGCWPHAWRTAHSPPWMGTPPAWTTLPRSASCQWWMRLRHFSTNATSCYTEAPMRVSSDRRARGPPPALRGPPQWARIKRGSLCSRKGRRPSQLGSHSSGAL